LQKPINGKKSTPNQTKIADGAHNKILIYTATTSQQPKQHPPKYIRRFTWTCKIDRHIHDTPRSVYLTEREKVGNMASIFDGGPVCVDLVQRWCDESES